MFKSIVFVILLIPSFFCYSSEYEESITTIQSTSAKNDLPDDFQELIVRRKAEIINQNSISEKLRKLQEDRDSLPRNRELIESKISEIEIRMGDDSESIESLEKKPELNQNEKERLKELKGYIEEDRYLLRRLDADQKRIYILDEEISLLTAELHNSQRKLTSIEHKISNKLNLEDEKNTFRILISGAFCILVAIVIIGFFFIAIRKESIAESIFFGEKGIQFVTIFLIVIAIILFGIMGILESKELSALLGGLSGYILGRVSTGKQDNPS